jgi:IS605 OrfB family transposase
MTNEMTLSYQTRLRLNDNEIEILSECATLYNSVEHSLYAEAAKGKTTASCKNEFLKKFGITARQFNACRVSLEGKIAACRAGQEQAVTSLKQSIEALEEQIRRLEKKPSKHFVLHQKKRRKSLLSSRLSSIDQALQEKRITLCFGGKKLFHAQFFLEQNGFSSHQEWKRAWEFKRNSEFFVLGSKDESGGNQTCTAFVQDDGRLTLRLRLPQKMAEKRGKYLEIQNVAFAYGHEAILASLTNPVGQAVSYRFKKDDKGFRVFVSTNLTKPELVSIEGNGVIGIDLNANHIAYVETDRFGNLIHKNTLPWISYGKTHGQLKAITGDFCKKIVEYAKETKKPIVLENLDFKKKKLTLKEKGDAKFSRLLSGFAYSLFFVSLMARAYKNGIAVHQVNPAFTSVIGRVNYAKRYGLSIHLAAALCIARRHQKFSEAPCSPNGMIPDGRGYHVAFDLPVRNRTKHVWHFWGQVKKKLSTVLAAHFRAICNRSLSPPSPTLETVIPDCYWCNSNT